MHWKREKEDIRVRLTISTEQFSPRRPLFQISLVACLRSLGLLASLGIFSLIAGCGGAAHSLVIAGSTSVQPVMEKIVEAFHKRNPGVRITVEGGGSSAGVMATVTGAAQLGMVSRNLKLDSADESGLKRFPLAMDAIAIIVHPHNPVSALSIEQLRELGFRVALAGEVGVVNMPMRRGGAHGWRSTGRVRWRKPAGSSVCPSSDSNWAQ